MGTDWVLVSLFDAFASSVMLAEGDNGRQLYTQKNESIRRDPSSRAVGGALFAFELDSFNGP